MRKLLLVLAITVPLAAMPMLAGANHYAVGDTPIGELMDDADARAVVDKYIPGFSTNEHVDQVRSMTLKAVQNFFPSVVTDAALAGIQQDLGKLPEKQAAAPAAAEGLTELAVTTTEEGQHVAFDRYTWKRRELAKHVPLDQPFPGDDAVDKAYAELHKAEPAYIKVPSRILPDVYLVNSEPNLTYVIDGGDAGLILVDPGLTYNVASIQANIRKLGLGKRKVKWVLNTHAHFDHAMADEEFRKAGADILIGAPDADAVEKGTAITAAYLALPNVPYPVTKVADRIADGEVLRLGNKTFYAIATPGHTPGSTSYLLQLDGRNLLFSGDILLYDNRLAAQLVAYIDNQEYLGSLRKLAGFHLDPRVPFHWDVLLPGHGAIVLDRAFMDVEKGFRTTQIDQLEGYPIEALPFATRMYRTVMFGRP